MVTHRLGNIAHAQNWPRTQAPRKRQRTCEQTWGLWKKVRACTCVCVCVCVCVANLPSLALPGRDAGLDSVVVPVEQKVPRCDTSIRSNFARSRLAGAVASLCVFGSAASATKALP